MSSAPQQPGTKPPPKETAKETIISVIMSFAMVFVFTRFVMASYVIPTGSMAPTLMGAHLRFHSEQTGDQWAVNPWAFLDPAGRTPARRQNAQDTNSRSLAILGPVRPTDEITGQPMVQPPNLPLRSGDRIFVLNYLDGLTRPRRWDVVVFKYPGDARENYIKRLVGMPNEQVLIVDGDVFTRPDGAGWRIERKSSHVQRSLWRQLFSSEFRPLDDTHNNRRWRERWVGQGLEREGTAYRKPEGDALLRWDPGAQPIDDWVRYNDSPWLNPGPGVFRYPVSDLRMRAGVQPDAPGATVAATIAARSHEFQAIVEPGRVAVRMRRDQGGVPDPGAPSAGHEWTDLASAPHDGLRAGRVTNFEFWHVDQTLEVWLDGKRVVSAPYDWTPETRLAETLVRPGAPILATDSYREPRVVWTFGGPGATVFRVGLDRDLYYQPSLLRRALENQFVASMARGADLNNPLRLAPGQYFVLGDNSAASGDGRAWDSVDPWVAHQSDDTPGVVAHDMLMGKAFLVFFPSLLPSGPVPMIDVGRMRLIW